MKRLALVGMLSLLSACGAEHPVPPGRPTEYVPPSEVARAYLTRLVDIMEYRSVRRLDIDWTSFRASVDTAASGAQTITDTHTAIRRALILLNDSHSSYRAVTGQVITGTPAPCLGSSRPDVPLPANVGYVHVGAFTGSGDDARAFATSIQDRIRAADRADLVGWIVDLRGNMGGNMWPMLAGLGPILGEGTLGFFIDTYDDTTVWEYRGGAARSDGAAVVQVAEPYQLLVPHPRVAVLTDNAVASSGEATAIAFRGRTGTRSFGKQTCGLSTANVPFTLSDGAVLNLSVATMADRTGRKYGVALDPDVSEADATLIVTRAVDWLQGR